MLRAGEQQEQAREGATVRPDRVAKALLRRGIAERLNTHLWQGK